MLVSASFQAELRTLLRLAGPIILSQLGIVLTGVADTVQVGRMAGDAKYALDAAGVANGVWITVSILGLNALGIVAPLISKAREAGDDEEISRLYRASQRVAVLAALGCGAIVAVLAWQFSVFRQTPPVEELAVPYLFLLVTSTLPFFWFTALRQLSDGLSHTRLAMLVTLSALLLNVLLNHVLINGVWGFPAWGLNGAGVATLFSRLYMAGAQWVLLRRTARFRPYLDWPVRARWWGTHVRKIFRIGIPSGMQGFFEIAVFSLAAVMVGWLGEEQLAAHLIAISPASVTYMMVTGVAAAGGIRVGAGLGQQNPAGIRQSGITALLLGGSFMLLTCLIFLLVPEWIVGLYIRDATVAPIAIALVRLAGLFQLVDGIQAVSLGILRGLADVNVPTAITLVAYWGVGLPVGALLTFGLGMDVTGIWLGLTAGLAVAAVLLSSRFFLRVRRLFADSIRPSRVIS
jgi:MATE family multidrug resistance protein